MLCRAGARQIAEAVLAGIRFTSARTPLLVAARALGAAVALATALLWPALTGAAAAATSSGSVAVVAPAWAYPADPPPAAAPRPGPDATTPLRVPRGSVAHGRTIALRGVDGPATACTVCHGADLHGSGPVPPLAVRSPSYLLRQLLAFRSGARAADADQPMQPIVQRLGLGEMIAVAAYVAAQPP